MPNEIEGRVGESVGASQALDVKRIIADLQAKGLSGQEILASLEQLAQEGKITAEELEEAKKELGETEDRAKDLFGTASY